MRVLAGQYPQINVHDTKRSTSRLRWRTLTELISNIAILKKCYFRTKVKMNFMPEANRLFPKIAMNRI